MATYFPGKIPNPRHGNLKTRSDEQESYCRMLPANVESQLKIGNLVLECLMKVEVFHSYSL